MLLPPLESCLWERPVAGPARGMRSWRGGLTRLAEKESGIRDGAAGKNILGALIVPSDAPLASVLPRTCFSVVSAKRQRAGRMEGAW